jgi:hypothetical protein
MSKPRVESLKKQYPKGTKIELHAMPGEDRMPPGLKGEVRFVDDAGQIHTAWENGSSLALIPGEDSFSVISEPELGMGESQQMNM